MPVSSVNAPRRRGALRLVLALVPLAFASPVLLPLAAGRRVAEGTAGAVHSSRPGATFVVEALPCRQLRTDTPAAPTNRFTWSGPWSEAHARWCDGVGPAVDHRPLDSARHVALSELGIVSWNMQGGGGDIDALIQDVRSGRLHGVPTSSFVLLLQEAIRTGPDVPMDPLVGSKAGKRVAPNARGRERQSIEAVASRNGLHLFYVPSVRNGGDGHPAEDRGNAILSSVPLEGLEAIELPLERERRVAVAARIRTLSETGDPVDVQLVNVHLDLRSSWRRVHRSLGAARASQARVTVERFARESVVIVGGDLNTWFGGRREAAVRILHEAFPHTETVTTSGTLRTPGILPDLSLDHLFFRLPPGMRASHEVIGDHYGSDHHPLVARVLVRDSARDVARDVVPDFVRDSAPRQARTVRLARIP